MDNSGNEIWNATSYTISAGNNWWGAAFPETIDFYGAVDYCNYLSGPPGQQSIISGGTGQQNTNATSLTNQQKNNSMAFKYDTDLDLNEELKTAYYEQNTAQFQSSANRFKSYFTDNKDRAHARQSAIQYMKSLSYYLDAEQVSQEIENTLAAKHSNPVRFELLSGQSSKLVSLDKAKDALLKLDEALKVKGDMEDENRARVQKALIYIHHLNETEKGKTILEDVKINSAEGSADYELASEELNILSSVVISTSPKFLQTTSANLEIGSPKDYKLLGNYPNPFNPSTAIRFNLPYNSQVGISIFNSIGQQIKSYNLPNLKAGLQEVNWEGKNELGQSVPSGLYILRFTAYSLTEEKTFFNQSIKMLLIR